MSKQFADNGSCLSAFVSYNSLLEEIFQKVQHKLCQRYGSFKKEKVY